MHDCLTAGRWWASVAHRKAEILGLQVALEIAKVLALGMALNTLRDNLAEALKGVYTRLRTHRTALYPSQSLAAVDMVRIGISLAA